MRSSFDRITTGTPGSSGDVVTVTRSWGNSGGSLYTARVAPPPAWVPGVRAGATSTERGFSRRPNMGTSCEGANPFSGDSGLGPGRGADTPALAATIPLIPETRA